jgi:hypothetical protein
MLHALGTAPVTADDFTDWSAELVVRLHASWVGDVIDVPAETRDVLRKPRSPLEVIGALYFIQWWAQSEQFPGTPLVIEAIRGLLDSGNKDIRLSAEGAFAALLSRMAAENG